MPRPQIIRADTIDLQDPDSPSAQDHSRQPTNPNALGDGPPAPHQAATLRNSGIEGVELHGRSPRASQDLSSKELQLLHEHVDGEEGQSADGELAASQRSGEDGDEDDEGEDSMEDDMMDKISSSPSIDDGGYTQPGISFFSSAQSFKHSRHTPGSSASSSPYTATPDHLPLNYRPSFQETQSGLRQIHEQEDRYNESPDFVLVPRPGLSNKPPRLEFELDGDYLTNDFWSRFEIAEPELNTDSDYFADSETDSHFIGDDIEILEHYPDPFTLLELGDVTTEPAKQERLMRKGKERATAFESSLEPPEVWPTQECSDRESSSPSDFEHYDDDDSSGDDYGPGISYDNPRFTDYGWTAKSLRDPEDIDFEFVYALHTFVATVEGQANATKGDTMVLLDDSNSYWWLVRVVKDSSIGYLPAEHIETPTERLARLNKHRNIDLSQTMLGDNPEKTKNPLKKAMRRRNAKTVTFAEPTYFEASENEYSSDNNEEDLDFITSAVEARTDGQSDEQAETAVDTVAPLNIRDTSKENGKVDEAKASTLLAAQTGDQIKLQDDKPRAPVEQTEPQDENLARSNRKMRNTDSFFGDDGAEPKKFNLTPSLLRDEPNSSNAISADQSRNRGSLESSSTKSSFEKPPKEDKRKEKKGMLGGLFKRRDRKSKTQSEEDDSETVSSRQSPQPKVSSESAPSEPNSPGKNQPVRQTSKLQKNPPPSKSNSFNKGTQRINTAEQPSAAPQVEAPQQISPLTNPFDNLSGGEVIADTTMRSQKPVLQLNSAVADTPTGQVRSPTGSRNLLSPIRDVLRTPQNSAPTEPKPEKVKKAATRMMLEDSDESQDELTSRPREAPISQREIKDPSPIKDHLSESPVHVAPVHNLDQPPALIGDSGSSQDDVARSLSSPTSSPELIERPTEDGNASGLDGTTTNTPTSTARSSSKRKEPRFDWGRLKRWFDEEFDDWYAEIMDVSEQMKDFDWTKHWAYKAYGCDEYMAHVAKYNKYVDDMEVDFWDTEMAKREGRLLPHPPYRLFADEEWYEKLIEINTKQGKKRGEYWIPWEDPEYAYLFPNREDRVQGPHVATGPPPGYRRARKPGEADPRYYEDAEPNA